MRRLSLFVVALVAMSVAAGTISAAIVNVDPQIGDGIKFNRLGAPNGGGPFRALLTPESVVWETYCVEDGNGTASESVSSGVTYTVESVASNPATKSGNFVSDYSKWLYYMAQANPTQLSGYSNTLAWKMSLQAAIWHGVYHNYGTLLSPDYQSLTSTAGGLGAYYSAGAIALWTQATNFALSGVASGSLLPSSSTADMGSWVNSSYVNIVNPIDATSKSVQSMLYLTPDAHEAVPEPVSLIVWSVIGAGAAGMVLRPRRSRARWSAENRQAIHAVFESKK